MTLLILIVSALVYIYFQQINREVEESQSPTFTDSVVTITDREFEYHYFQPKVEKYYTDLNGYNYIIASYEYEGEQYANAIVVSQE